MWDHIPNTLLSEASWKISAHPHPEYEGVKQRGSEHCQGTLPLLMATEICSPLAAGTTQPACTAAQLRPKPQGFWASWGWAALGAQPAVVAQQRLQERLGNLSR